MCYNYYVDGDKNNMPNKICYFIQPPGESEYFPSVALPGYNREYKSLLVSPINDTFVRFTGLSLYDQLTPEQVEEAADKLVDRAWRNVMIKSGKAAGLVDENADIIESLAHVFFIASNHRCKTVVSA